METPRVDYGAQEAVSLSLFLDDEAEPFATYRPPATASIDTTKLADGSHVLHVRALNAAGDQGVRSIAFVVANGPGITITGLRANERVSGTLELDVNAFSASDPFDPVRAESSGPIPVWTWVMIALIAGWAGWYALTEFRQPAAFGGGTSDAVTAANEPMSHTAPTQYSGNGAAAGFDYAATGPKLYSANCSACHGDGGIGVPGAFPALKGDPVVTSRDPKAQVDIVLHGLSGKPIAGTAYSGQMPPFARLSDSDIAAIVDHERTSWGNNAPTITPGDVRRAR